MGTMFLGVFGSKISAFSCPCRQQLIGIMEAGGGFELLDLDDLEPCSR
jgi:hypothetical protein